MLIHQTCCPQEAIKGGLDHKSLSQDIVKHAQYHYNPGRDVVFRGEFIPVRLFPPHVLFTLLFANRFRSIAISCNADQHACAACRRRSLRWVQREWVTPCMFVLVDYMFV